jgi:hypothetical protein
MLSVAAHRYNEIELPYVGFCLGGWYVAGKCTEGI